jgi:hypothetical protein
MSSRSRDMSSSGGSKDSSSRERQKEDETYVKPDGSPVGAALPQFHVVTQPNLSVNITKGQVGLIEEPGCRSVTFTVNKNTRLKTSQALWDERRHRWLECSHKGARSRMKGVLGATSIPLTG